MKTFHTLTRLREFLAAVLWFWVLQSAHAQTVREFTPLEMRGIWYPKGDIGQRHCARVRRDGAGELHAGALQITRTQLVDWSEADQNTVVFVTEVRPRRHHVWRLQGLEDVFPYETSKVLKTYLFELNKSELRWFKQSFDLVAERVSTHVYERCL